MMDKKVKKDLKEKIAFSKRQKELSIKFDKKIAKQIKRLAEIRAEKFKS